MHSKADAITAITHALQAAGGDVIADPAAEYDLDAIADVVYATTDGYDPEQMVPADFWAAVEKHARLALTLEALDVGDIVRIRQRGRAVVVDLAEPGHDLRRGPVHYYLIGNEDGRPYGRLRTAHPEALSLVRKVQHWSWERIHAIAVAAPELGDEHYRRAVVPLEMGDTAPDPQSTKWRYRGGAAGGTLTYQIHPVIVEVTLAGDIGTQKV